MAASICRAGIGLVLGGQVGRGLFSQILGDMMGVLPGILHASSPGPLAGCRLVCKVILPALPSFFFFFFFF